MHQDWKARLHFEAACENLAGRLMEVRVMILDPTAGAVGLSTAIGTVLLLSKDVRAPEPEFEAALRSYVEKKRLPAEHEPFKPQTLVAALAYSARAAAGAVVAHIHDLDTDKQTRDGVHSYMKQLRQFLWAVMVLADQPGERP